MPRGAVALVAAIALRATTARAQGGEENCVAQDQNATFVAFSANAPEAVFRSDDGCLAGGGRGVGCCPGSVCGTCVEETNAVHVEGGASVTLKFFNCLCEPCPAGTVQPLAAQKTCVACPAGWFNAAEGRATCEPCPVGTFSTKVGNTVGCTACGAGTSGKSTLADYYEKTTRSWRAPATGDGSTFDPTLAATFCADCPAGTSGGGAGDACTPCAPGYYSAARAETCTPCPVGTYSVLSGGASIDSCIPCAAGESNDATGSTECWQVCPISLLSCAEDAVRAKRRVRRARARARSPSNFLHRRRHRRLPQPALQDRLRNLRHPTLVRVLRPPQRERLRPYASPPPPPPAPPPASTSPDVDAAAPNATTANASAS